MHAIFLSCSIIMKFPVKYTIFSPGNIFHLSPHKGVSFPSSDFSTSRPKNVFSLHQDVVFSNRNHKCPLNQHNSSLPQKLRNSSVVYHKAKNPFVATICKNISFRLLSPVDRSPRLPSVPSEISLLPSRAQLVFD